MEMSRIFTLLLLGTMFSKILGLSALGAEETYWLTQQDNYLVVSSDGGLTVEKTDTRVSSLPPSDGEILNRGLLCKSKESLQRALENFCS